MRDAHNRCLETADEYAAPGNYVVGGNVAGFHPGRGRDGRAGTDLMALSDERQAEATGTVVVGVDGSDQSADALALALMLAGLRGARLSPVFVHPYARFAGAFPESKYEQLVTELADSVHTQMRALDLPAADRRLRIVTGRSASAGLQKTAENERAAMIVVGGSHRSRLGRVLPGGTAERLLAGAPCPVAIAPRGYAADRQPPIFVGSAFDGSAESDAALTWATGLARSADLRLRLLSVHERLPSVTVPAAAGLPLASVNDALREQLWDQLTDAEAVARQDGLEVTGALLEGDPAHALADASVHLDLLVLGSRGYGPVGAVLLGSVSNALVRTASCPVVVLPRSAGSQRHRA
jgi:nucleotide-binding universal stress UspA family protein